MKRIIITIALALIVSVKASAQKLPSKVTITLTDRQILRIDSAIKATANMMDSKTMTTNFITPFNPLYEQINKQMIIDTTKVKQSAGKP